MKIGICGCENCTCEEEQILENKIYECGCISTNIPGIGWRVTDLCEKHAEDESEIKIVKNRYMEEY